MGGLTYVSLVGRGRKTGEVSDMLKRSLGPVDDDNEGEYQTAQRIEPPYPGVETDYAGLVIRLFDPTIV